MIVIESLKKESVTRAVKASVEKNTKIESDKSTSYVDLEQDFHISSKVIAKDKIIKV